MAAVSKKGEGTGWEGGCPRGALKGFQLPFDDRETEAGVTGLRVGKRAVPLCQSPPGPLQPKFDFFCLE